MNNQEARAILKNLKYVLAIELLCAAQGLDLRTGQYKSGGQAFAPEGIKSKGQTPGRGVDAAYEFVREHIAYLSKDRLIKTDIETAFELIDTGELLAYVESEVGALS